MVLERLMEADVSHHVEASKYEGTPERVSKRNGCQHLGWETRVAEVGSPEESARSPRPRGRMCGRIPPFSTFFQ